MFYSRENLKEVGLLYCSLHGIQLSKTLGFGLQGVVYATTRRSAVKIHCRKEAYVRERNVYLRLTEEKVQNVKGLIVPQLLQYDDDKLIIEMELVSPPFIVDFGGAYLDVLPAHATGTMTLSQWDIDKREQFGENWLKAQAIIAEFAGMYSIHIVDVNPGNIRFKSEE